MANQLKLIPNTSVLRLSEDDIYIAVYKNSFVPLKKEIRIDNGTMLILGVSCKPKDGNKFSIFNGSSISITQLEWLPILPNTSSSSGSTSVDIYLIVCKDFKSWEIFPCDLTAHTALVTSPGFYKKLPNHFAWSALLAVDNLDDRRAISEDQDMLSLAAHDFQNGKSNFPQLVHYRGSQEDRLYKVINRNVNTSATGFCSLYDLSVLFIFICSWLLLFILRFLTV